MTKGAQQEPPGTKKTTGLFSQQVGKIARLKLKANRSKSASVWFGLGMMGLIGWSVVVPTLLGALLGLWLDDHYPQEQTWTLALMIGGLCLGCFNAWIWVDKEDKHIHQTEEDDHER